MVYTVHVCFSIFQKFAPLPCWLVKGSRVHVCSETLETGARPRDDDDDDDDDDTAVGNLEVRDRIAIGHHTKFFSKPILPCNL